MLIPPPAPSHASPSAGAKLRLLHVTGLTVPVELKKWLNSLAMLGSNFRYLQRVLRVCLKRARNNLFPK